MEATAVNHNARQLQAWWGRFRIMYMQWYVSFSFEMKWYNVLVTCGIMDCWIYSNLFDCIHTQIFLFCLYLFSCHFEIVSLCILSRTLSAILFGTAAGTMAMTGWQGFVFYIISSFLLSVSRPSPMNFRCWFIKKMKNRVFFRSVQSSTPLSFLILRVWYRHTFTFSSVHKYQIGLNLPSHYGLTELVATHSRSCYFGL